MGVYQTDTLPQKYIDMKMKKTKQTTIHLNVVVKLRDLLFKKSQEASKYKRLYINMAVECTKLEQRLNIEEYHTGFYADCMEYLCSVLSKAQNSTNADIDTIIQKFNDFRRERFMKFMEKRAELSTKQVSINGKIKTLTI